MAVVAVRASSPGNISLAFPCAPIALLRRASMVPGLQTRRPRLAESPVAPDDTMPAQSRIVLRDHVVCFR